MAATGSSMISTGQPAVAPELWIARIAEIWNPATGSQMVRQAGVTYTEPVLEGWFVPDYVVAEHPELTNDRRRSRRSGRSSPAACRRARFISCPADWGCSVVNRNLLKANGLDQLFDIVEPANRFELDTLIAEAVSRQGADPLLLLAAQLGAGAVRVHEPSISGRTTRTTTSASAARPVRRRWPPGFRRSR